jgi:hypothetical protein
VEHRQRRVISLGGDPSPRRDRIEGEGDGSMTIDDDPEVEYSPLCERVSRDGKAVELQIFRLKGSAEGWSLEVVDDKGGSTVWDDLFATDQDARDEFYNTLELEGIRGFSDDHTSRSLH